MPLPTITIRSMKYPKPSMDRLKLKQARKLGPILKQANSDGPDALPVLWEMLQLLIPTLPDEVLEDLELPEVKALLEKSGLINFTGDDALDPDEITVGESSASTNS